MTCCAATTVVNLKERLVTRQLSRRKLILNAVFKYTTHCWKSCGADNLEQIAKLTILGPR